MKSKVFKSTLSLLLALMLCVSVFAPAVSAATVAAPGALGEGEELPVVALHATAGDAPTATVTKAEVKKVFDDLELGEGDCYGIRAKSSSDDVCDLSGETASETVTAGEYTVFRTAAEAEQNPDWEAAATQDIAVRLYFNASFAVNGCDDGELYLNDEAVTGTVQLFTDAEYTVTAKAVESYDCVITGANAGEAFSPDADMTVTADYSLSEYATVTVSTEGEGTVSVLVDGEEAGSILTVGASFEVNAQPNTDKGYKLGAVAVTKNGEEIEAADGKYGPAADKDEFAVSVTFAFDPDVVNYEVNAAAALKSSDFNTMFNESGRRSYGYASVDQPGSIKTLNLNNGNVLAAGEYYIYSTAYSRNNPDWSAAKVKKLVLKTFYNANFTVTGSVLGEVYVNGLTVADNVAKLYTDSAYTITAKAVDEYFYTMTGAEDGAEFTPTSDLNVKVAYFKNAHATFTLTVNGVGTASVKSEGEVTEEIINEGSTFTVETSPNTARGYKLDSVVVTKDGEEVEAAEDGAYGPVEDGEVYSITVNFKFDPDEVSFELHEGSNLSVANIYGLFGDNVLSLLSKSYGIATVDDPTNVTKVTASSGYSASAGYYYIYRADGTSNPNWTTARALKLKVRTYYNGSFTVTGHEDGELYINGEAKSGDVKLYTDAEYTVTAKDVEGYDHVLDGVAEGETFTPTANVNATLTYSKPAFATFTISVGNGGTATVHSDGFEVTEHINEGSTFTVEPNPNTGKGYKTDTITVTKDGEEVEPVDGAYGPVADGESYEISVTFKFEPNEVRYNLHATDNFTSSIICDIFGDNILYMLAYSYGYAPVDDPQHISTESAKLEPGEYYIYKASGASNPDWSSASVLKLTLRTYYNASFAVSGHEEGEVYLNGEAKTGNVRLYTGNTYTITTKAIEEYICTLYGAEEGVEFAPTADIEVTASYVKDKYANVTVNVGEGGSVKLESNGFEVFDKVAEDCTFTVTPTANANNGYYVESVTVTKDGEEVEAVDGAYGPVLEGENYEVTVTFARAVLTLTDGTVSLQDIYYGDFEAIENTILGYAQLTPEEFTENAQTEIEYLAYTLLGMEIYASLNYSGDLAHAFGANGGTLKGGNTEKVRVTVTLPDYGIELRATATMTVDDDRIPTSIESSADSFTITYGDDLKAAVFETLSVYLAEDEQPLVFTEDDITLEPASLNANLTSAFTAQQVTVRYNGTDIYASCETTVDVFVNRAQSTLEAENETVTYGETPEAKVVTTPEDLDHLKVIAGIDTEVNSFVSIIVPESVKERMQIKIAGIVVLDLYQMLLSYVGEDGASLDDLKEIINKVNEYMASSDSIRQAIENSGFNVEVLERAMNFILGLPDLDTNIRIRLDQVPKNAGTYLMFSISTDTNYTTSEDLSYIVIKPKSSTEEEPVELRFKQEMQYEDNKFSIGYEEAQSFEFGGDLYVNDELTQADNIRTLYVGTTVTGDIISQSEPVREPGVYTETVYMLGGNYLVTPIVREYTITRISTELMMDDLTVPYDGKAHTTVAYFEDGSELTGLVTTIYRGTGYLSTKAPVNAGEYTVRTTYAGDAHHKPATVTAKLTIERLDVVITMSCKEEFAYGDLTYDNLLDADLSYTVSGTIDGDSLGFILPRLNLDESFPNVGEYTVDAVFIQSNFNYNVTIENATVTIVPKQIAVAIDDAEKCLGDDDPEFTYTVTDAEGNTLSVEPEMTLAREEGEELGEYRIYISEFKDANFTLIEDMCTEGKLTIRERREFVIGDANGDGVVNICDVTTIQRHIAEYALTNAIDLAAADVDGDGKVDILDASWIQTYLAEMDCPYDIGGKGSEII